MSSKFTETTRGRSTAELTWPALRTERLRVVARRVACANHSQWPSQFLLAAIDTHGTELAKSFDRTWIVKSGDDDDGHAPTN
jgi:hypothetical protein